MNNITKAKSLLKEKHKSKLMALDFIKYIGPGLLVTIGFIDPGNWVTNVSAGSSFGYSLLWVITLSTIFLILLQHNAAHLGIVTGKCLSEAATTYMSPVVSRCSLISAMVAAISTAFAEILGGAIALNMLFKIPIKIGAFLILCLVLWMLFSNSYRKIEKWIIGFVSIIGISFIIELCFVNVNWSQAAVNWLVPSIPTGSMMIIMGVLGAVVMPHNLFLHSEVIQSRQWNLKDDKSKARYLKYEFTDTFFSMLVGWAINSAMILIAATTFFTKNIQITELSQAQQMLKPLLGDAAAIIFAIALLFAGISSSITAGMSGGCIFSGIFEESYDINDRHTKIGVALTFIPAVLVIFFISNPLEGIMNSQILLSIQLPITIFLQLYLTSSKKVMGKFKNSLIDKILLWGTGIVVSVMNIVYLVNLFFSA